MKRLFADTHFFIALLNARDKEHAKAVPVPGNVLVSSAVLKSEATLPAKPRGVILPPMSITAIVEKDTIKLPVHVPDGTRVEIVLPEKMVATESPNALSWLMKYAGTIEGPEDFASEHDHYIHGTPKRSGQ